MKEVIIEITLTVPDNYRIENVESLLDDMEDKYSKVSFVKGEIIKK